MDVPLQQAKADNYDALLLLGGVMNPDKLRMDENAVRFVRKFLKMASRLQRSATVPEL